MRTNNKLNQHKDQDTSGIQMLAPLVWDKSCHDCTNLPSPNKINHLWSCLINGMTGKNNAAPSLSDPKIFCSLVSTTTTKKEYNITA